MQVEFTVPGKPFGKQRPKFARRGKFVTTYTPDETVRYENLIKLCFQAQKPDGWPLDGLKEMFIYSYFPVLASWSEKKKTLAVSGDIRPDKKPDLDNIIKAVGDALNGVAFSDDSRVVAVTARKMYAIEPRLCVRIETIQ